MTLSEIHTLANIFTQSGFMYLSVIQKNQSQNILLNEWHKCQMQTTSSISQPSATSILDENSFPRMLQSIFSAMSKRVIKEAPRQTPTIPPMFDRRSNRFTFSFSRKRGIWNGIQKIFQRTSRPSFMSHISPYFICNCISCFSYTFTTSWGYPGWLCRLRSHSR